MVIQEGTRSGPVNMDTTAIAVAAIAAVPLSITACASLLSARRSKQAKVNSAAAEVNSADARQFSKAARDNTRATALTTSNGFGDLEGQITFLTHMIADHMADNERHIDRRS